MHHGPVQTHSESLAVAENIRGRRTLGPDVRFGSDPRVGARRNARHGSLLVRRHPGPRLSGSNALHAVCEFSKAIKSSHPLTRLPQETRAILDIPFGF